jgi:hypothetical protein
LTVTGYALDASDARDDPGGRYDVFVEVPRGERRELEERRAGVEQAVDALAHEELAALDVPRPRLLVAAATHLGEALAQLGGQLGEPRRRHALRLRIGRLGHWGRSSQALRTG